MQRINLKEYRMSDDLIAFMKEQDRPLDRHYVIQAFRPGIAEGFIVIDVEKDWHNEMECPFYDTAYSYFGETISLVNGKVTQWRSDYPKGFISITKIGE